MNNHFYDEIGMAIMSFWGKLVGDLFGTITNVWFENGKYYIITNQNYKTDIPNHFLNLIETQYGIKLIHETEEWGRNE